MVKVLKSWQGIVLCLLFLFVLIYAGLRADAVSLSHDEALSFRIINGDNELELTANHHMLNTWLMSFTNAVFGPSEFSLRLPNLFGLLLFFVGLIKVLFSNKKRNMVIMIFLFSFLLFNPYLVDFFALARGYGLGLGFGMLSFAYLISNSASSIEAQNSKAFKVLGFMLLAVYANLTYINYFLIFLLIIGFDYYRIIGKIDEVIRSIDFRYYVYRITGLVLLIIPAFRFLFQLKNQDELYFGGDRGLVSNTLNSLLYMGVYFKEPEFVLNNLDVFSWSILCLFIFAVLYQIWQRKYGQLGKTALIIILLVVVLNIQFYFMDALFPQTRTALFLMPLIGVFFFHLFNQLASKSEFLKWGMSVLSMALSLGLIFHFATSINVSSTAEWKYDGGTKVAHGLFQELKSENSTISYDWLFGPAWEYYEYRFNGLNEIPEHSKKGIVKGSDFIYCFQNLKGDLVENGKYKIVKEFGIPQTMLLQKVKD